MHRMLSAFDLFRANTEKSHQRNNAWGRLRTTSKSAAILSVKETVESGNAIETVHFWDNNTALNCKIAELTREEVPATPPKLGTKVIYNAITPEGGTKLNSSGRSFNLTITNADQEKTAGTVHILSPEKQEIHDHIFSLPKSKKKRSKHSNPVKRKLSLEHDKENAPPTNQRGQALLVKPNKKPRKKERSQVSVMGASPNEEWKAFQELLASVETVSIKKLQEHPALKVLSQRMQNDPEFRKLFTSGNKNLQKQFASEWLHEKAHSLAGADTFEAQVASNMALGPKWINSFMMILEMLALATSNNDEAEVTVKSEFQRLPGTRIVDKIKYDIHAVSHEDNSSVDIGYTLNALETPKRSNCASSNDAMHLKTTAQNVLTGTDPTYTKVFKISSQDNTENLPLRERLRSSNKRKRYSL